MPFAKNENELKASVPMKFKVEGGETVKILSNLWDLKTHYAPAVGTKPGASVAYMGEDSEAVALGWKVKKDYFYLVELKGEKVVLLVPAGCVFAMNEYIANQNKTAKKNGEKDKRDYSWNLVKTPPKTKNDFPVYSATPAEEIARISPAEVETYNTVLEQTMTQYEERTREKYYEYVGAAAPVVPVEAGPEKPIEDVDTRPMDEKIDIDDIPF